MGRGNKLQYADQFNEKLERVEAFYHSNQKHQDSESKRERWHGHDMEHRREKEARHNVREMKAPNPNYVLDNWESPSDPEYLGESASTPTVNNDVPELVRSYITIEEILGLDIPQNYDPKEPVFSSRINLENEVEEWEEIYNEEVNRVDVPLILLQQESYRDTIFSGFDDPVYHGNSHQDEHYASRLDRELE